MRILFVSTHAFLPSTRKTSVHFVSEALAERGHAVATLSVGYSLLTRLKDPDLYHQLVSEQKNRFVERHPGYRSACYMPAVHPFSSENPLMNRITGLLFRLYGNVLPRFMKVEIEASDIVILESGSSICFFDAIRRINDKARIFYFNRDRLDTIGASQFLIELEQRIAVAFDRVFLPSPRMAECLPPSTKVRYVPQGIDKASFDQCETSPYPVGIRNAVSVGNMLFDHAAVAAMAYHNPAVTFHLFGAGISGDFPSNVKVYGERSFEEIIPYIKFADFGLAPYRLTEKELYLARSSLKLQQYSYCLLPILVPDLLADTRDNLIAYRQTGEDNWVGVVDRALTAGKNQAWRDGILSWDEVAAQIEDDFSAEYVATLPLVRPHGLGGDAGSADYTQSAWQALILQTMHSAVDRRQHGARIGAAHGRRIPAAEFKGTVPIDDTQRR
jgi:2-beta-glucuronyltransferase